MDKRFEVIVVGGGHAGTEAALAAARMGVKTLLITQNIDTLGQMSCNPSIGGIGKGHLVKEVDALGGAMALATDKAGIQFRVLNASKGSAVQATRAQADRELYRRAIRNILQEQDNLWIFQDTVEDILMASEKQLKGVLTRTKITFLSPIVVLTNGTFLDGKIHIGLTSYASGRMGEAPSQKLSLCLKELQLPQGRLKTGTPPRLDARSIDFSVLEEQWGDEDPIPVFSFLGKGAMHPPQRPCWITHTNSLTHEIIRKGLDQSPLYTGIIEGVGPRYCPSIEDKIHRFAGKESHQIFLEPEGWNTQEIYPNGVSTSLPFEVQLDFIRSMKGLEQAVIVRPGYAIEYDYFDPRSLHHSLESRFIEGLFFAGQVNGTTGYEEAAAQGLLAGLNAALKHQEKPAFIPSRQNSYIGVMVDDLVSKGVQEPYRMFTSRAEFRLYLREDNADLRLTEEGYGLGCVSEERFRALNVKRENVERLEKHLRATIVRQEVIDALSGKAESGGKGGQAVTESLSLYELLLRPEWTHAKLCQAFPDKFGHEVEDVSREVIACLESAVKYGGYIARQKKEYARLEKNLSLALPSDLDYRQIDSLSIEVREKLAQARPATFYDALKVSGVTPAAIANLMIFLRKAKR